MSYTAAHNAVRTRFATLWGAATPVSYPNLKFNAPANSKWVRYVPLDSDSRQASFGAPNNIYRQTAMVTLQIFVPFNSGDGVAIELAENAVAIFRGWQDSASGVLFREPPFVRRIGRDGGFYQVNVLCPFEWDDQ